MPPHILAVFNQLYEELKAMKQQQWTITNYGALILAAIYAVRQQFPDVGHAQSKLKVLAFVIAIVGSGLLLRVQYNMVGTRYRLDDIHNNFFTSNELKAIGWSDEERRRLHDERRQRRWAYWHQGFWDFSVPLMLVLWGGAILVCLAL
jgi:hypothetical protein